MSTQSDFEKANLRIGKLLSRGTPKMGSTTYRELMKLAQLVENYEERKVPLTALDPVEAILFRLEQLGRSRKELEGVIGSRARVSEVLSRKRELSKEMIVRLHRAFEIPLESLLGVDE